MGKLTRDEIAAMIDYASALNPNATKDDIIKSCNDAIENKFNAVAVTPDYVALAARQLKGSGVKVLAAVGFPWGSNTTETKVFETKQAIKKMSKMDFINFAEEMRSNLGNDSIMLYKLKGLLE